MLTEEGLLVVRDVYAPGKDVDGFQAGPCWLFRGEPQARSDNPSRNWFDAPPWDTAWWQTKRKRVLLYVHPSKDQSYGVARHDSNPDVSREIKTDNFFAKTTVRAGKPKVLLSVFVPHDVDEKATEVLQRVSTRVDASGACTVGVGVVVVSIGDDGRWEARR